MLIWAVATLGAAALLGSVLAIPYLRGTGRPPPQLALLHLALGLGGFGLLILAPPNSGQGAGRGTAAFGMIASVMIGMAALIGIGLLAARNRRRRLPGAAVGIHAAIAVGGFVILLAYVLAG